MAEASRDPVERPHEEVEMRGHTQAGGAGENLMTVRDVADYLRLSRAKVYQMVKAGEIPSIRIGRAWRFRRDLIEAWVQGGMAVERPSGG